MKISQWDPRGEIMSTNKALFFGIVGLEEKNGAARPEKSDEMGLEEKKEAARPGKGDNPGPEEKKEATRPEPERRSHCFKRSVEITARRRVNTLNNHPPSRQGGQNQKCISKKDIHRMSLT